jgi:hypothetical protein
MRWLKRGALLSIALAAVSPVGPLQAQRWEGRGRGADGSVEHALRLRDTLQLTDDQVAQLQSLRQEAVAERQAASSHLIEARSRLRAGEVTREEFQEEVAARREEARSSAEAREERFSGILSEDQGEQLATARRRAFRTGGRGGRPGGRGHGYRGWGPAGPERGYGPGRGWRGSERWMGPGRPPFRARRPWE